MSLLIIPCRACAARDTVIVQCVCTSHSSLVSGYITQYFGQLGFERHGIEANRNGFLGVRFVVEKKRGKTWGLLYTHARGAVSELRLATDLPAH